MRRNKKGEVVRNINIELPIKEFQRLRNLKEQSGAKDWKEFLCDDKLDISKRGNPNK